MPNIPKPWPKGLDVKDSKYDSLEDELWAFIKWNMGLVGDCSISTEAINEFLQDAFGKIDIRSELRSFMRYLSQDERFLFEGPSRVRMVRVVDRSSLIETEGWKVIATEIVNYVLELTANLERPEFDKYAFLELGVWDLFTHFEKKNGDKMFGFSEEAFDFAIVQLRKDNRVFVKGEDTEDLSFPSGFDWINREYRLFWNAGSGFLGYGDKKSSGMRLPVRVWNRIEEIIGRLNRDRSQIWGERMLDEHLTLESYSSQYTDNALLAWIMESHIGLHGFTTSQIVEAGIELLYAEMERATIGDWENYVERSERYRRDGTVDMIIDGVEVEVKVRGPWKKDD